MICFEGIFKLNEFCQLSRNYSTLLKDTHITFLCVDDDLLETDTRHIPFIYVVDSRWQSPFCPLKSGRCAVISDEN